METEHEYVTIALWDYTKGDPLSTNHLFPVNAILSTSLLEKMFHVDCDSETLSFVLQTSNEEFELLECHSFRPSEIVRFVLRGDETQPISPRNAPTKKDLEGECVTISKYSSMPRLSDWKCPAGLETILQLSQMEAAVPTTPEFKALMVENCKFANVPLQSYDSSEDEYLGMDRTSYYKYWIEVERIRQRYESEFMNNSYRTEEQWLTNIYEPLFKAASPNNIVSISSCFDYDEQLLNAALKTDLLRSYVNEYNIPLEIADGWLVKNNKDTAGACHNKYSFHLDELPFNAMLGDETHLLLDCVVAIRGVDESLEDYTLNANLAVTASVMHHVTKENDILNFGFDIDMDYVGFNVIHRPPSRHGDVNPTTAALEITQVKFWSLGRCSFWSVDRGSFYKFAMFLWRLRTFRMKQFLQYLPELQKRKKGLDPIGKSFGNMRDNELMVLKRLQGLACVHPVLSTDEVTDVPTSTRSYHFKANNLSEVFRFMLLLFKVLQVIHSRGVVHGSIDFRSVIYEPNDPKQLNISNFSCAVVVQDVNSLVPSFKASTKHAAPEVSKWSKVGVATDVFSAGIMFVELLYGTQFTSQDDSTLFRQLVDRVENKFHCPAAAEIVKQMIARDWMQRISVSAAIEKILQIQPELRQEFF